MSSCNNDFKRNERETSINQMDTMEGFGEFDSDFNSSNHEHKINLSPNGIGDEWLSLDTSTSEDQEVFHQSSAPLNKINALCGNITERKPVSCWPKPNVLNPCEDMMSWAWLRISVWIVLSSAIIGNISVLVVLAFTRTEKSVPRFLMCNLALADFLMAIYLLLLAIVDLISTETYFNFALGWQYGSGCKIAGFLTVFASQLSLFTLSVLTVERWLAIRHALYRNSLDLKTTKRVMAGGWLYAFVMATLPLFGISSYSSTSICLPMEISSSLSLCYIILLLAMAAFGFVLMCFCYIQIYLSLSYETRSFKGEGSVAKKITVLVATNFICWAPIAFFSITAVAGYPLISVTESKILLVFFYPLNSCANPYLYAILTKKYRKECTMLLARNGLCKRYERHYRFVYSRPSTKEVHANTAETQF